MKTRRWKLTKTEREVAEKSHSTQGVWNNIKQPHIPVTSIQGWGRTKQRQTFRERTMAETFPNFMKSLNSEIQEAQKQET